MKIKVTLEHKGIMPERRHWNDAAINLFSPVDFFVGPFQRFTLWTGVKMQLPEGTVGLIRSMNHLSKKGMITDGVLNVGENGQIGITMINTTKRRMDFVRGDIVGQLMIVPAVYAELEVQNEPV